MGRRRDGGGGGIKLREGGPVAAAASGTRSGNGVTGRGIGDWKQRVIHL